jgi:hypothetical protein
MCATSPFWRHGNHRFGRVQPSLSILAKLSLFRALVVLKLAESGSAFATLIPSDLCFLSPQKRGKVSSQSCISKEKYILFHINILSNIIAK